MTTSTRIEQLEWLLIELDREIRHINMVVACKQGAVKFSDFPRWAEAYSEIEKVERELAELRQNTD